MKVINKSAGASQWDWEYDYENRLISHTDSARATSCYAYDAMSRRISKTVNSVTEKYIYDGPNVICDYDGSNNNLTASYLTPFTDENVLMVKNSNTYYFMQDGLGSVRNLIDSVSSVVNSYDYNAFGESLSATEGIANRYKYTGREWDGESATYYYRARQYNPATGRFLRRDPMEDLAGLNLYTYVKNNPVNLTDPFGLEEKEEEEKGFLGSLWDSVKKGLEDVGTRATEGFKQIGNALAKALGSILGQHEDKPADPLQTDQSIQPQVMREGEKTTDEQNVEKIEKAVEAAKTVLNVLGVIEDLTSDEEGDWAHVNEDHGPNSNKPKGKYASGTSIKDTARATRDKPDREATEGDTIVREKDFPTPVGTKRDGTPTNTNRVVINKKTGEIISSYPPDEQKGTPVPQQQQPQQKK